MKEERIDNPSDNAPTAAATLTEAAGRKCPGKLVGVLVSSNTGPQYKQLPFVTGYSNSLQLDLHHSLPFFSSLSFSLRQCIGFFRL